MLFDFLKLVFSKEFIQNASSIINILRKSKNWKNDIEVFNDTFYSRDILKSDVLIDHSLSVLASKGWDSKEISDTKFIMQELRDNAFQYGLPDKAYSTVYMDITVTTPYIKIEISDDGTFDLMQELSIQECTVPGSKLNKGLSFIYQITPEISQSTLPRNCVVVIKRKGCKPIETQKIEDIVVLKVGSSHYISDDNYSVFGKGLLGLNNNKIIIDFGANNSVFSFVSRGVREARTEISAAVDSGKKVCVCGLSNAPLPVKYYFEKEFHVEETLHDAIKYIKGF